MLNNHYMARARGFTLVELLVAISIIAILSVTAMVIYSQVTVNARDARRKLDLQNIAQALEVYYQKNGRYPTNALEPSGGTSLWVYSNAEQPWISDLDDNYISSLPKDPKENSGRLPRRLPMGNDEAYGYAYWSGSYPIPQDPSDPQCPSAGQWYALMTLLENGNDPDRMEEKKYKWCNGDSMEASASPYSYVVTPR